MPADTKNISATPKKDAIPKDVSGTTKTADNKTKDESQKNRAPQTPSNSKVKNLFTKLKQKKWWIAGALALVLVIYFILRLFNVIPGEQATGKYLPKVPAKKQNKIIVFIKSVTGKFAIIPSKLGVVYDKIKQARKERLKDKLYVLQKQLKQKEQQLRIQEDQIKQSQQTLGKEQSLFNKEKIQLAEEKQKLSQEKKDFEDKLAKQQEETKKIKVTISKEEKARQKNIIALTSVYENMKPSNAANIIQGLDENFAIEILQKMDEEQSAKILAKMDAKKAASLTKKLSILK